MTSLMDAVIANNAAGVGSTAAPRSNDQPGYVEWDGQTGTISSRPQSSQATQPADFDQILRELGLDPDQVAIVGHPSVRSWDASNGQRLYHYKATIAAKTAEGGIFEMPDLDRLVRRKKPAKVKVRNEDVGMVVALADIQAGKTDARGGTPELVERLGETLDLLEQQLRTVRPGTVFLADVGDIVEGFESAGGPLSQATRNDMSLMRQVEFAAVVVHQFVATCAKYAGRVVLGSIPSNHCSWRSGKANLGKSSDDWGLSIVRNLAHRYADDPRYQNVEIVLPAEYTEHIVVDVLGTNVGVVHGHQARTPEKIGDWWGAQVHGGSSLANADLLLAGHYHNWRTYPSGRSAHTGREKRVYVAPTLDNGSSWFSNGMAGADSDPGLLVLTVQRGVGVVDHRVLRPGGWQ